MIAALEPNRQVEQEPAVVLERTFDYDALGSDEADYLRSQAEQIRARNRNACENVINIGSALREVKDRLDYGQFGSWLDTEFGWTSRTARNYMAVADRYRDKTEMISVFDLGAMYELAADSTPDDLRDEFEQRAAAGEPIRGRDVKAAKRRASTNSSGAALRSRTTTSSPRSTGDMDVLRKPIDELVELAEERGWDRDGADDYAAAIITSLAGQDDTDRAAFARKVAIVSAVFQRVNELLHIAGRGGKE